MFFHHERNGSFDDAMGWAALARSRRNDDSVDGTGGKVGMCGEAIRFASNSGQEMF